MLGTFVSFSSQQIFWILEKAIATVAICLQYNVRRVTNSFYVFFWILEEASSAPALDNVAIATILSLEDSYTSAPSSYI